MEEVSAVVAQAEAGNMVQLVPYQTSHFDELNSFQLDETQSKFTASVYENIVNRKIETIPGKFPVTILHDEIPVGFFILDDSDEKTIFTADENAVLLRSLSLNPKYQGKGIGKDTMILMDDFVRNQFPHRTHITLAVNARNEHAIQLYVKTGYQNTNRTYDGSIGPQFILSKQVN
ncbi:Acetyltransferase (GNAT) family protein [Moheibacter sediminis]|uniref:Acetyltransferase (GNAT) family protein n=1 Tax=Moheibacter sediminis TaxID=1434700 RepID=A0A1W1ZX75_9FLAO|nr:Acetyltransferase (GNAT) family protein [Moheibacter sediminis]